MDHEVPGFDERLRALIGADRVRAKVPLAPLTTFKVGGPADWLADVRTEAELRQVLTAAAEAGVAVTVIGGGSNVVVADAGIRGLTVRLHLTGISQPAPDVVRAEAGVTINGLVRWMIGRGLAGLQAWAGTPGTVGGAIYGNAHWSGRNIGDLVARVRVASITGEMTDVVRREMQFAYDTSRLQVTREILVWAEFETSLARPDALRARARESLAFRKRTQPLALPSAGCVFQNPDPAHVTLPAGVPYSAGALVDRAGLKGRRVGGAIISPTHANFIVNDGTATAADIRTLIETARAAVRDRFGVELLDEVVYLGTF
jgi:UDP-N-acetylmuramate dehydrogenase